MLANGDLPLRELSDIIHIPPDNLYEIQSDSGIAIRESLRQFVKMVFPDINANFHTLERQ